MARRSDIEFWMYQNNMEVLWCNIPSFEEVMEGVHALYGFGNDGTGVKLVLSTDETARAEDDPLIYIELVNVAKAINSVRYAEMKEEMRIRA